MEKPVTNDKELKVGNTTFNKDALSGMTEKDFKKSYAGKIDVDIKKAWKKVKKYTKK